VTALLPTVALLLQVASNAELGYRFPLPQGFEAFAAGRSQPDVVDCWTDPTGLVLCVQRMHGTLGQEHLSAAHLPHGTKLSTLKWKAFDVDVIRTDTVEAGASIVVFAVQVPLRPEAIQLVLAGPSAQASGGEAILATVLAGLEGQTNWLTSSERAGRWGTIVGWVVGIAIGVIIVRLVVARRRGHASA
jgi:hypothetical protein